MNKKPSNLFCGDLRRGLEVVSSVLKESPYNIKEKSPNDYELKSHKLRKESSKGFELNALEKRCLEDTSWLLDNLVIFMDKLKEGSIEHIESTTFSFFPIALATYDFFRKDEKLKKYCEENKISTFPINPSKGFTQIRDLISNYLHGENNNEVDRIYASMFFDKLVEEEKHVGLHQYEKAIKTLLDTYSSTKK